MPRYRAHLPTPFGPVLLASDGEHLTGFWFEGQKDFPPDDPQAVVDPRAVPFPRVLEQMTAYARGERRAFDLPLAFVIGTPFQQAVWRALLGIRQGDTVTYAEIARRVGRPAAVRAVGAAVGRNPISVIVPCHRVVGSDGSLTGYAGGIERKRALLRHEGVLIGERAPSPRPRREARR